jgi:hypothetical protein
MHEERSNCSSIGVMVYIIFIFARRAPAVATKIEGFFVQGALAVPCT